MRKKVKDMTNEEKRQSLEEIMRLMPEEMVNLFTKGEIRMILMEICAFHVTGKFDTRPENIPSGVYVGDSFKDSVERLIEVWEKYNND